MLIRTPLRTSLDCTTALYDPEKFHRFPGLESLIFSLLVSSLPTPIFLGLSNAAIGAIASGLSALATTAIVSGINMLMMPKPPKPQDGKLPKVQNLAPVIFGVGTNRVSGAYVLWEAVKNKLYSVQALVGHEVSAFQAIYLHDDPVTIGGPGSKWVQKGEDGRYGTNRIQVETRSGAIPETAYPDHVAALSGQGIWTAAHRGDGIASLGIICESVDATYHGEVYPHGAPQASAVIDMAPVWDFRDPAQDPEVPSTWTFSRNVALCLAWWLCFCPYGPRWDYRTALLPLIDRWKEEADICDEAVPLAGGGSEPRYEVNGWADTSTDPIAILNAFLAACDGFIAQHGDGALELTVGKFREELVGVITDADLVGYGWNSDVPEEDAVNRLVPRFTYPATDYSEAVTDYFESTADQLRDGRVLSSEADFRWVHRWRQARRLGKREWKRLQAKVSGSLDLRLSAYNQVRKRWIRLETPNRLRRMNGKVIENRRAIIALMQGGFQMEFARHPDDIEDWNPATDEGSAPPAPPKPTQQGLPTPTIDTVTPVKTGATVALRVSIIDYQDSSLSPVVRYRLKDAGGGQPGPWVQKTFPNITPAAGLLVVNTDPVPVDSILEVQAAVVGSKGTVGPFSTTFEVSTSLDSVAPAALAAFGATGGAGQLTVNLTTAVDGHLSTVAIYRVPTGGPITPRPAAVARPAASSGLSYAIQAPAPAGTWDIYAEPMNVSGVPGPLSGPATVTVT